MLRNKGFTLIELIVTLAILAILAGVAYPSLMAYRQNARAHELVKYSETVAKALKQHYAFEGRYPALSGYSGAGALNETQTDQLRAALKSKTGFTLNTSAYIYRDYDAAAGVIRVEYKEPGP